VPEEERRSHARRAAGARRERVQRREAGQPWLAWLLLRGLLALLVLAAAAWSVLLLHQSRGGFWPLVALVAGALSLVMIGLDVAARQRQRRRAARPVGPPVAEPATDPVVEPTGGFVPEPPPAGRRRAHRR
jgi:hypothetical protein